MRKQHNSNEVEVIIVDDPWAEFGPPLPEASSAIKHPAIRRATRVGTWFVSALLTVCIHLLVATPLLLGGARDKLSRAPMIEGAASTLNQTSHEFVTTLILLNDRSITTETDNEDVLDSVLQNVAQARPLQDLLINTSVPTISSTTQDDNQQQKESTAAEARDTAGQAMLFGRYMGQIKARIERAWDYPTETTPTQFHCKVQIKQNKQGDVKEVTLQQCDANPAWQVSLVRAIQSASPLSAPPDDAVFSEWVTLGFDAQLNAIAGTNSN